MAKAKVGAAGIEYISGAMKRPKKQNGHNHGNYLVATHRTAETTSSDGQRIYSFDADRYKRSTPVKPSEVIQRERFAAISRAVNTRAHDINKMSQDQAAFKAQSTYTTMRSYLWALEAEAYDQQNG